MGKMPVIVPVVRRFARCGFLRLGCALLWSAAAPSVLAAAYSLSPGGPLPPNCTSATATSYTCTSLALAWNDTLSVANANSTLTVSGTFTPNGNAINWSSPAAGFRINANAISGTQFLNLNGALHVNGNLSLGGQGQIVGNVSTNGTATVGGSITGTLTAAGAISTAWNTKITGAISGASFASGGGSTYGGGVTVTGALSLGHGDVLTGNASAGTTAAINGTINGTLTAGGAITSAWGTKVSGAVKGASFSGGGGGTYGAGIEASSGGVALGSSETVSGSVSARGAVTLGSSATVGGGIATTGNVTLQSSARVGTNIQADGAVSLGHATRVGGNVTSEDESVSIASSNAVVVGCVKAPKDGNRTTITLGWHASVGGVCCRPGNSPQCQDSCVQNGSGYAMPPLCTAMPPPGGEPSGFNCVETTTAQGAAELAGRLHTKLAGASFAVRVVALKDADGNGVADGVETGYAADQNRSVTVELVDGGGSAACSARTPLSPAVSAGLTFSAGDQGRKNVSLTSSAAHANVLCRVRDASWSPAIVACSTDRFSIRPSAATLTTPATGATAPVPGDLSVIRAGADFALKAVTAPGYTGNLLLDTGRLGAQKTDNGTTQEAGGTVGALTPATLPANTDANATYSEVGYLYLAPGAYRDEAFTAASGDRAGGDCILPNPADPLDFGYLSDVAIGGKYGCDIGNKSALAFGRFIPHRFRITPDTVTPACSGAFTYFGQDGLTTKFALAAENSGAGVTKNYQGVFARFDLTDRDAYRFAVSATTPLPTGAALAASASAPGGGPWSEGLAVVEARHLIVRPGDKAGITPVQIVAQPLDADGVTTVAGEAVAVATPLRYGRLQIGNAHGSELLPLPLPLTAQYWDGSLWKTNTEDNCSSVAPTAVAFSGWTGNLAACETSFAPTPAPLGGGRGTLVLRAPGSGNGGTVSLSLAAGSTCTGAGTPVSAAAAGDVPHFGTTGNPAGRATFGIYKTPLIDRRERY